MFHGRMKLIFALVLSAMILTACDTAEERAEEHFQSGMELLEAGDVDRALVEFKNVFELNGRHKGARQAFAEAVYSRGNIREAFSQYLLLAEQFPSDVSARISLTEIALDVRDWDEVVRHGTKAIELAPDQPRVKAIDAAIRYRTAVEDENDAQRREAADYALLVSNELDDKLITQRIIIDNLLRDEKFREALDEIDAVIANGLKEADFFRLRLSVLNELGETEKMGAQLEELTKIFPDDSSFQETLIRWYIARSELDEAETFLRSKTETDDVEASEKASVALVDFLRQTTGIGRARDELNALVESGKNPQLFGALLAGLDYEDGRRDEAIASLEELLQDGSSSELTNNIRVTLARMLSDRQDYVGARQRIDEVLSDNPLQVEALKMRAGWLIDDDKADEAIVTLRAALDQSPEDSSIMTIMARAHTRNGDKILAGDLLSLAFEASNSAPTEALRYAQFLLADEDVDSAEAILIKSLRASPGHPEILRELGGLYIRNEDWPRAEQVEATLRRSEDENRERIADALQLQRLQQQERGDEAIELLENLMQEGDAGVAASIAIVRAHITKGDIAAAENVVARELERDPSNRAFRFMDAAIRAASNKSQEAETIYRELLEEERTDEIVWRSLYALLLREGRGEEAASALRDGLEAIPTSGNLRWLLASELERTGDYDGAIVVYEQLYKDNSSSQIVANNLASLISTYRTSDEDLQRAHVIARRLRGVDVPAFQDTYGWIALRLGRVEEALDHLKPAASGLPNDPLVQYHLGMAFAQNGQNSDAIEQLRKALSIAGPADTRPQFETAKEEIVRLETLLSENGDN